VITQKTMRLSLFRIIPLNKASTSQILIRETSRVGLQMFDLTFLQMILSSEQREQVVVETISMVVEQLEV
jgi:hypothetical protein